MSGSRNIARLTPSNSGLLPNNNINAFNIGQIPFPASQNQSTNPNILDDYEEGIWQPKCGDGITNVYITNKASYTKIGNRVLIDLDVEMNSTNPGTANYIGGLPFPGKVSAGNGGGAVGYSNPPIPIGFHITGQSTFLYAINLNNGVLVSLTNIRIIVALSYETS